MTTGQPAGQSSPSASVDSALAALFNLIHGLIDGLDDAVTAARAIGPEWENVMEDIRIPAAEQLSDLAERLSSRMDHPQPASPDRRPESGSPPAPVVSRTGERMSGPPEGNALR